MVTTLAERSVAVIADHARVLRLVSGLCGSRFGRGVVVPGGISAFPRKLPEEILGELAPLERQVTADAELLMGTSSFLDRRRAGPAAGAG